MNEVTCVVYNAIHSLATLLFSLKYTDKYFSFSKSVLNTMWTTMVHLSRRTAMVELTRVVSSQIDGGSLF